VLTRIVAKTLLNIALVWAMSTYMSAYFLIGGGIIAYLIIGIILMLMNMIVRPLLHLITLPLKLFATLLAVIVVNGLFVQLTYELVQYMDSALVTMQIGGGIIGWTIVAVAFGIGNWLMKIILR